ncbi:transcriptional regulator [Polaribacter reichenbachii]|uniref:Transcriptional regulator n=1 Tax=Polaribacter reichenbachii TaxID=996801 RepID=A0A1B8U6P7_9FLAO|nr:GntR family transcriptional regulator [Polaribacter reichenbachii]APZ46063.1 transcriptional regulator [Polaribacter reichenbachii]AUC19925.1 transcriptional regulator [Polaribacter reichenbachii]OBY67531.1 transcriptional regulator [Polaribacter reichenbachii]
MFSFINIDENSRIPKYQQIVNVIIQNISNGNLVIDQRIPSINKFSEEFYLSRDTVEKAYNILKERNIISSIKGKGYYITRTKLISKINILFLVNKLSSYKLKIYNSFIDNIGTNAHTDLQIYHCDESLFLNLLNKSKSAYDYFVIMPHFKFDGGKHVSYTEGVIELLKKIPKEKLVILDNFKEGIEGGDIEVFQDFENDIYYALKEAYPKMKKYNNLILFYPTKTVYPYPKRILFGFRKFCFEYNIDFEFFEEVYEDMIIKKGDLFVTIEESDLVTLVKRTREENLVLGKDIGIISYNDTPLKELLGITVVSTDFKKMGEISARMILNKEKGHLKVPFNFIDRASL